MSTATLSAQEQQMFLDQIVKLGQSGLSGLWPTNGTLPSANWQETWRQSCEEVGLISESRDHQDVAATLWGDMLRPIAPQVLRQLAAQDGGAALMLHREAQGLWLVAHLGIDVPGSCVVSLNGHTGWGRCGLASWLSGRAAEQDLLEMADNWNSTTPRLLVAGAWRHVLAPLWQDDVLRWCRMDASAATQPLERPHAYANLGVWSLEMSRATVFADANPDTLRQLLVQECLGLLAIMAGTVDRALYHSLDYASQRRQGGRIILQWPAVRSMTHRIRTIAEQLSDTLEASAGQGGATLARQLRRLVSAGASVTEACHHCMQVHGGNGYMRDYPAERLLREANALRRLPGSPLGLSMLAEQLEAE